MRKLAILSALLLFAAHAAISQGCVAIRSTGGFCTRDQALQNDANKWILSVSLEPGLNYQFKKATIYAYVPFAIERNRVQSVADKLKTEAAGVYAKGDAAFADYLINVGCSFRF